MINILIIVTGFHSRYKFSTLIAILNRKETGTSGCPRFDVDMEHLRVQRTYDTSTWSVVYSGRSYHPFSVVVVIDLSSGKKHFNYS